MIDQATKTVSAAKHRGRFKPVILAENDRELLQRIVESGYWASWQVRNAKIVLGISSGRQVNEVAAELGCGLATVRRTCRKYQQEGLVGIITQRQRPGRPKRALQHAGVQNDGE